MRLLFSTVVAAGLAALSPVAHSHLGSPVLEDEPKNKSPPGLDGGAKEESQIRELREKLDEMRRTLESLSRERETTNDVVPLGGESSEGGERRRSLQSSSCACPASPYTLASDHGATGDSSTDDTAALQSAIDAAASAIHDDGSGGTVLLGPGTYRTFAPLIVPGGVTLSGQGYGDSPLAISFSSGASTIAYCGTDYAVKIRGHGAQIENLAVYDWPYGEPCDVEKSAGGILLDADDRGLESVRIANVLIYWFMAGTALTLRAANGSGIAYGSFADLRIRHAQRGIHISADGTSFANSNQFYGGAISGTIHEVGVLAEGPGSCNDNKFWGMVIEPAETSDAHVRVKGPKTNVKMHEVRLEGTDMFALGKPLVVIDDDSYGNVMTGMVGHTHVRADMNRNPGIDFLSAKSVGLDPAPVNRFENAAFAHYDGENDRLPGWSTPGSNRVITTLPMTENLYPDHNVLSIDHLGWGGSFKLKPESLPKNGPNGAHSSCTFGIYARTTDPDAIVATMRYESGSMISSAKHSGSGEWEFVGMSALMDVTTTTGPDPTFHVTGDVDVTAPFFAYGKAPPTPGASLMSASGAVMSGTLVSGLGTATPPASGNYWVLPPNGGNVFKIKAAAGAVPPAIVRLNHSGSDRYKTGAIITLLFDQDCVGMQVNDSAYIKLLGNAHFVVTRANSSLTLMSDGYGTWLEVSRNA